MRLLVEEQLVPELDLLAAELIATHSREGGVTLEVTLRIYIVPKTQHRIVIPFHRSSGSIVIGKERYAVESIKMEPPKRHDLYFGHERPSLPKILSLTVDSTPHEIIIDGPGLMILEASTSIAELPTSMPDVLHIEFVLHPVAFGGELNIKGQLIKSETGRNEIARWDLPGEKASP